MKSIKKFWCKVIVFVTLTGLLLSHINNVLLIKGAELKLWSCVSTYSGFYDLEKNSTDLLIFGTSHAFYNIIPQRLYDEYGIRSYNMGTPMQTMLDSYYMLKETLKYQSPKVVALEVLNTFFDHSLEHNEIANWTALGYMRWSMNKVEAIHAVCKDVDYSDPINFYLTNIRFHGNWKSLKMSSYSYWFYRNRTESKGYYPVMRISNDSFEPIEMDESASPRVMHDIVLQYLVKFVDLCKENNIQLILFKCPTNEWTAGFWKSTHSFAEEKGIPFYDFNLSQNYQQLGFDYANDIAGTGHCNVRGAIKCTDYLGKILTEEFNLSGQPDKQWEKTRPFMDKIVSMQNISAENNIDHYLEYLDNPLYTVFFSIKADGMEGMSQKTAAQMKKLGLFQHGEPRIGQEYVAVIDQGSVVYEQIGGEDCGHIGLLSNGKVRYDLVSSTSRDPGSSRIMISDVAGNNDYCVDWKGFNIVVYDQDDMCLIDSCNYNPMDGNKNIVHKDIGY